MKRIILSTLLSITVFFGGGLRADEPIKVVATLSTFADLVRTIGGDRVEVTSIAPAMFNPHFIEARPSDVLKVKRCELFVHAGLDLEAWRAPLVDAVGRSDIRAGGERQLDLSRGISLLEIPQGPISRADGDIHLFGNPHYWTDPRNGGIMAKAIAGKLSSLDPAHSEQYENNLKVFTEKLESKMKDWDLTLAPFRGSELIGYHNEWIYLMNYSGLKMKYFLEPKPGIPPTPKQVEFLVDYIKNNKIAAIVQATFYPKEAGQEISERTGSKLILLAQNVGEIPQASDYIAMIDYDLSQIIGALNG